MAWPPPRTGDEKTWYAWGPDGLETDWPALGLAEDLERVVQAVDLLVSFKRSDYPEGWWVEEARLYLGPQGWTLVVLVYDMDRGRPLTVAYVYGQPPRRKWDRCGLAGTPAPCASAWSTS